MKNFLEKILTEKSNQVSGGNKGEKTIGPLKSHPKEKTNARIAIYDSLSSIPRIIKLSSSDYQEFINILSTKTYQLSQEKGGSIPFTIIKELIENLIHAHFKEIIITILNSGNTIKISDQGPGIKNKEMVFEPGFSTANQEMKKIIKGVGSGLPITKEILSFSGGSIKIEDNLSSGCVITINLPPTPYPPLKNIKKSTINQDKTSFKLNLSNRQKKVLFLVTEMGPIGPSDITKELKISLSTAYRDLLFLEDMGLVKANKQGKRSLTQKGIKYLEIFLKL